jgi:hypothetical protein
MAIADELADKLAADVIAYIETTGDEDIIARLGQTLGDSSQTLQEAFITSVRVQRAAIRANQILAEKLAAFEGTPHPPAAEARVEARPAEEAEAEEPVAFDAAPADDAPDEVEPAETAVDAEPEPGSTPADRGEKRKRRPPVPTVGSDRPRFG